MKKIWKIFVGVIFLAVCSGCGIKKEQKKTIEKKKKKIYRECEMLAEGYRNIYENAVKENALYELSTIQKIIYFNTLNHIQLIVGINYCISIFSKSYKCKIF